MLRVFTDTDTEFTPKDCKKYGFELISMPYELEGKLEYPFASWEEFDAKTYYDTLRSGKIPTTSAINQEEYIKYFEPVFAKGDDILYIHFSSAMSASFGFMKNALDELLAKYPERKFYAIDTMSITIGSYIIVDELGQMYAKGAKAEEMVAWAEKEIQHFACYFFADDLKFFRKSGRVSGLASMLGNLIGIRPIIVIDEAGVMRSIDKTRGRMNAINYLVNKVEELGSDVKNHKVIIGHTDAQELVDELKNQLYDKYGKDLEIVDICVNPTVGGHCGPNGVGVAFHSIHR